jgi:hypothetical protein
MDKVHKKRGRKPKGGKIVDMVENPPVKEPIIQNIIVHLKCSSADIQPTILQKVDTIEPYANDTNHLKLEVSDASSLQQQVRALGVMLHKNDINTRADCFWCTCPYDTAPFYIPKGKTNGKYVVYGSFCCPECAAASLLSDNSLDNSSKFERYALLNSLYSKESIVPAPPPHYLLNKYYGTLTIDEYRKLVKSNLLTVMVEKPITCTFPDLVQSSADPNISMLSTTRPIETKYRLCRKR